MTGFLFTLLFAACALLALAAIAVSLRRYGPAALGLHGQLQECPEWREVRSTVTLTEFRPLGATVLRPDFRTDRPRTPARRALRAAA